MRKVIVIFALLTAVSAFAEVPNEITYQGKLKEYGQVVSGNRTANFKIYNTASGPGLQWESGDVSVAVSSGIFSYTLTPVLDWRQKDLWIETVISGKTLSPREKITSQAFAIHSRTAEDLSKQEGSSINFMIGGSTKARVNSNGEVSSLIGNTTYYMVPRGAIVMWSGSISAIPAGWILCDGSNGTPDLRDKFVMGSGLINATGDFGGNTVHQHSNITVSNSSITSGAAGSHSHKLPIFEEAGVGGAGFYNPRGSCSIYGLGPLENTSAMSQTVGYSGGGRSKDTGNPLLSSNADNHSHDVSHSHSSGSTNNGNNLPPFYALAFIMKN